MKIYLKFIKIYINLLSFIVPKYCGNKAFTIFQKIRHKKIKEQEKEYYTKATKFFVLLEKENLNCYEFGNPKGKLVFLVHGWDSNAGSLSKFAFELVEKGYRVIGFDLPAHANCKETHTNLFICKTAFQALLKYINPKAPFNVVSHSFGSTLSAYTLSQSSYEVDKHVMLTVNNNLELVFLHFNNIFGFNKRVYKQFISIASKTLQEDMSEMYISKKVTSMKYNEILIIHDKFDKVLPFFNAVELCESIPNISLSAYEKIGHYRMLWNDNVIQETINFINKNNNHENSYLNI